MSIYGFPFIAGAGGGGGGGNDPRIPDPSTAPGKWLRAKVDGSLYELVDPPTGSGGFKSVLDFGAVGDGQTDDSASIEAAFESGGTIFVPKGTYLIRPRSWTGTPNASAGHIRCDITQPTRIVAEAGAKLITDSQYFAHIQFNITSDVVLTIEGLEFDGQNLAKTGFFFTGQTTAGGPQGSVFVRDCILRNFRTSSNNNYWAEGGGLYFLYGFDYVVVERCLVENISRAAGTGVPGVKGTCGITIGRGTGVFTSFGIVRDCVVRNITCEETGANDLDVDGLKLFGDNSTNGRSRFLVEGCTFAECRVRGIKIQNPGGTVVRDCVFLRETEPYPAGAGTVQFIQSQYIEVTVQNCRFRITKSPITLNITCVSCYTGGSGYPPWYRVQVNGLDVENTTTDAISEVVEIDGNETDRVVRISGIVAKGPATAIVRKKGDGATKVQSIRMEDIHFTNAPSTRVLRLTYTTMSNTSLIAENIHNLDTTSVALTGTDTSTAVTWREKRTFGLVNVTP